MKDSKLNINRKPLSEEDFKKAENFEEVLSRYNLSAGDGGNGSSSSGSGSLFKSPWFWGLGGGAAVLAVLLFFMLNNQEVESEDNHGGDLLTEQKLIAPPLEGLEILNANYTISAESGGVIDHYGTEIMVPEQAFTDESGGLVSGEVEIRYREFHSLADIFISGIPMQYDSAGYTYSFESAGMFEIKAFQNGRELKTNPESLIEVHMVSKKDGEYFNQYYLNEQTGKWDFLARDRAVAGSADSLSPTQVLARIKEVEESMKQMEAKKPIPPVKRDPDRFSIKIEIDPVQFPELVAFGDVLFQVVDNDENFAATYAGIDWDDVKLAAEDEYYYLTFYKDMKPFEFRAVPVMDDATYDQAMVDFDAKFKAYENRYAAKMKEDSVAYAELKDRARFLTDSTDAINYLNSEEYQASLASGRVRGSITRSFSVRNFGIYNSDYPQAMPSGRILAIQHFINKDNEKDTLKFRTLHLADHDTDVLIALGSEYAEQLQYNPGHKTTFFMVTENNKLAVFYPEDFKKLSNDEPIDMELTVMDAPKDPDQASELLKL